jgi:hypothetical protein
MSVLTPAINVELRRAWLKLGGNMAHFPNEADDGVSVLRAFEHQGADSDLLSTIKSYGNTNSDDVLEQLRRWNGKA